MKGKLIKVENTFYLKVNESTLATSLNPNLSASICYSLSLKNCQEIERGYDLYDLNTYNKLTLSKNDKLPIITTALKKGFDEGFQKALEILGDKKFSEDDMKQALITMQVSHNVIRTTEDRQELIQSLQQTEWDVEIVTKNSRTGKIIKSESELEWDEDGLCGDTAIPLLDESQNLILKRI